MRTRLVRSVFGRATGARRLSARVRSAALRLVGRPAQDRRVEGVPRAAFSGDVLGSFRDGASPLDHIDVGLERAFSRASIEGARNRLSLPLREGAACSCTTQPLRANDDANKKLVCYDCGIACDLARMRRVARDAASRSKRASCSRRRSPRRVVWCTNMPRLPARQRQPVASAFRYSRARKPSSSPTSMWSRGRAVHPEAVPSHVAVRTPAARNASSPARRSELFFRHESNCARRADLDDSRERRSLPQSGARS